MRSDTPPVYYLNVSVRGYAAEILVNDAPICQTPLEAAYMAIPSVSEWMIEGVNHISAAIFAVDAVAEVQDPDSPQRLIVQLCVGEVGEMVPPGEEQVLAELRVEPADEPATRAPRTLSMTHTLASWPRWAWQDAPVFAADEATDTELWTFLETLHAELEARDIDGFLARQRVKFAELAPLYGDTPAEAEAQARASFAELMTLAPWSVAPLEREDAVLRRCCGGRVVELRRRDGHAALRSGPQSEHAPWSQYVFVARVNGLLEIIR